MAVPNGSLRTLPGQHEDAGVLDPPGREHKCPCPDRQATASEGSNVDPVDALGGIVQVETIDDRMQKDLNVRRFPEIISMESTEVHGIDMKDACCHVRGAEPQSV